MRKSRLMELLRTFSPPERIRLRLFVDSPYFSSGKQAGQLIALLDFCLTALDSNSESGPEKTDAYTALFPGEAFVAGKLEKMMSALYNLMLQFLLAEQYFQPENATDHQLALAKEFQNRDLPDRSGAALSSARRLLENTVQRDAVFYEKAIKLTTQELDYKIVLQPSNAGETSLNQNFEALYLYYHSAKQEMVSTLNALTQRHIFHLSPLTQRMLSEEPIPPEFIKINPTVYFSSQFIALIRSIPDINAFNHFLNNLRRHEELFSLQEVKNCWAMVRNVLTSWWSIQKNKELLKAWLDIFIETAARGYLYHFGKIHPYSLESSCKAALELNMPDVAYKFIQEHRGIISGEPDDEPYYYYNLARYHFYAGDLHKAIDLLPSSIPDNSCQMNAKILEIQILYELQSDLLPYRVDALRMFLTRTAPRLHSPRRLGHIRLFLNYFARICRCRAGDVRRSETIIAQIKTTPQTTEYYWLLKMAAARALQQ